MSERLPGSRRLAPFALALAAALLLVSLAPPARAQSLQVVERRVLLAPAQSSFGVSVATTDIDGDGTKELLVSAPDAITPAGWGCVWIYDGGLSGYYAPSGQLVAPLHVSFVNAGKIATLDFNGDGHEDVAVTCSVDSLLTGYPPVVAIYFGGPGADGVADQMLELSPDTVGSGLSAPAAGDFNGDGWDDLAIGEPGYSTGEGRVLIFFGGPGSDSLPDASRDPNTANEAFGLTLASLGDWNADGVDDLAVGAPYWGGRPYGRVYVIFGGPSVATSWMMLISGGPNDYALGMSLGGPGDLDGDGHPDLIAGGSYGGLRAFNGGPTADEIPDATYSSGQVGTIAPLGDLNADGRADFADASIYGAIWIYTGGNSTPATYLPPGPGSCRPPSACALGDLDGDGTLEVFAGFPCRDYLFSAGEHAAVYTMRRFGLLSPQAGDRLVAGTSAQLSWFGGTAIGAQWSLDDGATWGDSLALDSPSRFVTIPAPDSITASARLRVWQDVQSSAVPDRDETAGSLTIAGVQALEPSGSSELFAGDDVTVRWQGVRPTDIEVSSDGGASWRLAGTGAEGASPGAITWHVPFWRGDGLRMRASVAGTLPGPLTSSDFLWTGSTAPFRVVRPGVGNVLGSGTVDSVVWLGRSPADVDLTLDDGGHWTPVASNVGGASRNSLAWTVPTSSSTVARVRIRAAGLPADPDHAAESNGNFRIFGQAYVGGLATRALLTFSGLQNQERFGASVATGDFDGDGQADFFVGAPSYDVSTSRTNVGRLAFYRGGSVLDTLAESVSKEGQQGDGQASAICSGRDVNRDGYDDVIAGAPNAGFGPGEARLYPGGPLGELRSTVAFSGPILPSTFGRSVTLADFNADGNADVVVGDNAVRFSGTPRPNDSWLFFGGAVPDNNYDIELIGYGDYYSITRENYGYSCASAGDFNADGYEDVVVGGPITSANTPNSGHAYVHFGGPAADGVYDLALVGTVRDHGLSVAGIGDFNGDGHDDIAVGSPRTLNGTGAMTGAAYIYYGGPPGAAPLGDEIADQVLYGEHDTDEFGTVVASAGDMNGDGMPDLAVSAIRVDGTGFDLGRVYVYFGYPLPVATPGLTFSGLRNGGLFGSSIAAADLDGDGFSELVVGAPTGALYRDPTGYVQVLSLDRPRVTTPVGGETWIAGERDTVRWRGKSLVDIELSMDDGASWATLATGVGGQDQNEIAFTTPDDTTTAGRVRVVVSGRPVTFATADTCALAFRIVRLAYAPRFAARADTLASADGMLEGIALAGAGDMNGDGLPDLLVGRTEPVGGSAATHVELVPGGPSGPGVPLDLTPVGSAIPRAVTFAGAGDVNRDGFGDVLVGFPDDETGGPAAGRVCLILGGATPAAAPFATFPGAPGERLGASMAALGDINGDGFADFALGAPSGSGGAVRVWLGGATVAAAPDRSFSSPPGCSEFGASIAGGDFDGGGGRDIVVGAPGSRGNGDVFIWFADALPGAPPSLSIHGAQPGDRFGACVAAAGDVDGDGICDLLVSAPGADARGPDAGRVYLYLGGHAMNIQADLVIEGRAAGEFFGATLAPLGDANGDVFADFAIGAPTAAGAGGANEGGRVSLYLGSVRPDTLEDARWLGALAGDRMGAALAALGEGSGTAYGALAIGAPFADGSDAGRVLWCEFARAFVREPASGASWVPGAEERVTWLGAERARVSLVGASGAEVVVGDSLGGADTNQATLRVPAGLGGWARVHVTPSRAGVSGEAWSDTVRIESEVSLTRLSAVAVSGGVELAWATEPGVGPQGLAGYRVYRIHPASGARELVADSVTATKLFHAETDRRARYALAAVNGLGEEMALGETGLAALVEGMKAWPVPMARAGLRLVLAVPVEGDGQTAGDFAVEVYDVTGRKVADIARGKMATEVGALHLGWDGKTSAHRPVAAGVYFVRASSPSSGWSRTLRLVAVP